MTEKLSSLSLIVYDFDGVMTDNRVYIDQNGNEMVKVNRADGLEPEELKAMVTAIRNIEKAMGDRVKKPSPSEMKNMSIARRSIVAKKPISKGELFSEKNLTVKRPGTGVSPMEWDTYIGKLSDREYQADELI